MAQLGAVRKIFRSGEFKIFMNLISQEAGSKGEGSRTLNRGQSGQSWKAAGTSILGTHKAAAGQRKTPGGSM